MIRAYPEPTGLRVVLAAANPITALQVGLLLGMDGHDVRLAYDGASALAAAQTYDPDVLLLYMHPVKLSDLTGPSWGDR